MISNELKQKLLEAGFEYIERKYFWLKDTKGRNFRIPVEDIEKLEKWLGGEVKDFDIYDYMVIA
jgi:hypothetical protein